MSVVVKAFELLQLFSAERPEMGLTELHRLAGRDKATTFRHLSALESVGLLERNPATRAYRIGPAVLRLARLREAVMPRREVVEAALDRLAALTGETAHASALSGNTLLSLSVRESDLHSNRVVIRETELPLHATASGLAVLAFGGPGLRAAALGAMERFTEATHATEAALDAAVERARAEGFAVSAQGFEAGVHGTAAPLFDETGLIAGAVAVAAPASRMTPDLGRTIRQGLTRAAHEISQGWGGQVPAGLQALWGRALAAETA